MKINNFSFLQMLQVNQLESPLQRYQKMTKNIKYTLQNDVVQNEKTKNRDNLLTVKLIKERVGKKYLKIIQNLFFSFIRAFSKPKSYIFCKQHQKSNNDILKSVINNQLLSTIIFQRIQIFVAKSQFVPQLIKISVGCLVQYYFTCWLWRNSIVFLISFMNQIQQQFIMQNVQYLIREFMKINKIIITEALELLSFSYYPYQTKNRCSEDLAYGIIEIIELNSHYYENINTCVNWFCLKLKDKLLVSVIKRHFLWYHIRMGPQHPFSKMPVIGQRSIAPQLNLSIQPTKTTRRRNFVQIENQKDDFKCICNDFNFGNQSQCEDCGLSFHPKCLKSPENEKFECPLCFAKNMDPLNEAKNILFAGYLSGQQQNHQILFEYNVDSRIAKCEVEIRCLRLDGKNNYSITWPDAGSLTLNDCNLLEFKPIAQNSSLKKRKDQILVVGKKHIRNHNSICISQSSGYDKKFKVGKYSHFIAVCLVNPLMNRQIIRKIMNQDKYLTKDQNSNKFQVASSELSMEKVYVDLRCPLSFQRIKIPIKGRQCTHERCQDLETTIRFSKASNRAWKCSICKKKSHHLVVSQTLYSIIKNSSHLALAGVTIHPNGAYEVAVEKENDNDLSDSIVEHVKYSPQIICIESEEENLIQIQNMIIDKTTKSSISQNNQISKVLPIEISSDQDQLLPPKQKPSSWRFQFLNLHPKYMRNSHQNLKIRKQFYIQIQPHIRLSKVHSFEELDIQKANQMRKMTQMSEKTVQEEEVELSPSNQSMGQLNEVGNKSCEKVNDFNVLSEDHNKLRNQGGATNEIQVKRNVGLNSKQITVEVRKQNQNQVQNLFENQQPSLNTVQHQKKFEQPACFHDGIQDLRDNQGNKNMKKCDYFRRQHSNIEKQSQQSNGCSRIFHLDQETRIKYLEQYQYGEEGKDPYPAFKQRKIANIVEAKQAVHNNAIEIQFNSNVSVSSTYNYNLMTSTPQSRGTKDKTIQIIESDSETDFTKLQKLAILQQQKLLKPKINKSFKNGKPLDLWDRYNKVVQSMLLKVNHDKGNEKEKHDQKMGNH